MSIFNHFYDHKPNSTNNRLVKFKRNAVRNRNLRMESLEERTLLSAVPLSASEYADLRAQYADFNLPENMADLNVITLDLAQGDNLTQLQDAITMAGQTSQSDLIVVHTSNDANTLTYSSSADELNINIDSTQYGSVTIVGWGAQNLTLDANQKCRVMNVEGETTVVNLGGLTFTHGQTTGQAYINGGGGVQNTGSLTVANCTFSENTSSVSGGGIRNAGILTVLDSTFSGNTASRCGGGIGNADTGTVNVRNSTFLGNDANQGGGLYNYNLLTVTDSTISENTATYGGGIYNASGTIEVTSGQITDNTASNSGGGIYNSSTAMVTDSTISENTATSGGGICNLYGTIEVTSGQISDNTASVSGGGVYNSSTATITDTTLSGNTASVNGGGIYNSNTATVTNSTISGNTASSTDTSSYGGGIYTSSGMLTVTDCTISGNTSSYAGGGIYKTNGTLDVVNSIISENTSSFAAGICHDYGTGTITGSTITGNTASSSGGGINNHNGTLTIENCIVTRNSSHDGGGIRNYSSGIMTVSNSVISGNTASYSGGGIYNFGSTITVTNSTIAGNSATAGGGICTNDSCTVVNSIVILNHASSTGSNINGQLSAESHNNLTVDSYGQFVCDPVLDSNGALINAESIDLHLRSYSSAIDAGDSSAASGIVTDVEGNTRVYGDSVDIGAYEYQGDRNDEPLEYISVVDTLNDSFDLYDDEWSLREALFFASEYVAITFAADLNGTITLTRGQLEIDKALAIDGDGRITIDAAQNSRIFRVEAGTAENPVVLSGLSLQNGKFSGNGSGIFNSGTLTVADCTLSGNSAGQGGGIFNSGTLTVVDCTLSGNSAGQGGGIFNSRALTVMNCTISENTARNGGGIYSNSGTMTFTSSLFLGNTASHAGGGICNDNGTLTVADCTVSGNEAVTCGGGINNDSSRLTVTNSIISQNTSEKGGGIRNSNSAGNITLTNCTVTGNTASGSGGGFINMNNSTSTINNSILVDEIYKDSGTISGSNNLTTFTDWTDGSDNLIYDSAKPLFVDAENGDYHLAEGSQAIDKGNNALAVDADGETLLYDLDGTSRILDDTVDIGAYESICYNDYQAIRDKYSEFDLPKSENDVNIIIVDLTAGDDLEDLKNAITMAGTTTLSDLIVVLTSDDANTLTYSTAADELNIAVDATQYGSVTIVGWGTQNLTLDANQQCRVMSVEGETTVLNLGGLTITNGQTSGNGGGIYNYSGTLTVTNSEISGNTTPYYGGGIWNNYGTLTVINSTISGNTASNNGSGIWNYYGILTVTNSEISENSTPYNGGGIWNYYGPLTVTNSEISGNIARSGGGIYSYSEAPLKVSNCTISRNTASSQGGGIYNYNFATLTVTNSTISGNTANRGGGISHGPGKLTVTNSTISENTATTRGGGIGWHAASGDTTITVINSTITENIASEGGGIESPCDLVLTNSTISGNTASSNGGGIYANSGTITVTDSKITENTASNGGGIYMPTLSIRMFTVTNSTISGNTASSCGGGILYSSQNKDTTITVINSTILGNTAAYGGGIYNSSPNPVVTVINTTIWGNSAYSGAGIYNPSATFTLTNSIVGRNNGGDIRGDLSSTSSNNLIGVNNPGFVCPPLFDSDGKLINAGTMDLHLRSDSIAINMGDNAAVADIETDMDGNARIYGGTVDIGAYEYQGDRNDEPIPDLTLVNTLNDSFDPNDDEWSLREAIYYASGQETITFAEGLEGTIVLTMGQLDIFVPLTIDGDDRIIIDGNQKNRVFYVSAGTEESPVVLKGLTIQNGNASKGGGIYNNSGTLTLTNSTISGNTASSHGGGILCGNNGILSIVNSQISGNTALTYYGGGIYQSGGTMTVTNSEISGNQSLRSGCGIYNNDGILSVTDSLITGNTMIEGNESYKDGGGIYNTGELTITNSEISNNSVVCCGGGIYNSGTATVRQCTVQGNSTSSDVYGGGGFYNREGNLTIEDTDILDNVSNYIGGGIRQESGTLTVTNCLFSGNTAESSGGGIINGNAGKLTLASNTFTVNSALWAGAVGNSGELFVTDCTFSGNNAVNSGGGIYQSETGKSTVMNTAFTENTASWGGGIYNSSGNIEIMDSTFSGNTGSKVGGGIRNNYGVLNVTNCTFSGNESPYGGGIYNVYGTMTVTESTLSGNNSSGGGGICNDYGIATISNSTISGNTASNDGGGGINNHSGTLKLINCVIVQNSATNGGGIRNYASGLLRVTNSTIAGNTASDNGSGIYHSSGSSILNNSIIVDDIYKNSGSINGSNNLTAYTGWSSGSDNITYDSTESLFVDSENGDYHLAADSQALNKGKNSLAQDTDGFRLAYDLDGSQRVVNGTVDLGAYEYNTGKLSTPILDPPEAYGMTIFATWSGVVDASAYLFEYKSSVDSAWTAASVSGTAKTFTGLHALTYTIRVKAIGAGNLADSDYSPEVSIFLNREPTAEDDAFVNNGQTTLVLDVLANDSDPDGDALSILSVTQPESGTVVITKDETILYFPSASFSGSDSFTYTISDGFGGTSTATVTITAPENAQPAALNDSARVELNGNVLIDVLANDSDPDGDALSVLCVVQPANGTAVITKDDKILYLPKTGFAGTDSFTYTVSDGRGGTAEATVSVEVIRTLWPLIVTPNEASPALISEWETFSVELHSAEGLAETQTVCLAWDASLFELNTAQAVGENGVSLVFGEAVTENGITTQNVVLNVENAALLDENALLASLEFLPVAADSITAGDSTDWTISVNREALNVEVESFAYDLNDSGGVDINDLVAFARVFGNKNTISDQSRIADFDENGTVDINDLVLFARNFGKKRPEKPAAGMAAVYAPEVKLEEMPAAARGNVNDAAMAAYWEEME